MRILLNLLTSHEAQIILLRTYTTQDIAKKIGNHVAPVSPSIVAKFQFSTVLCIQMVDADPFTSCAVHSVGGPLTVAGTDAAPTSMPKRNSVSSPHHMSTRNL